jgi:hypothetical protein
VTYKKQCGRVARSPFARGILASGRIELPTEDGRLAEKRQTGLPVGAEMVEVSSSSFVLIEI